MLFYESVLEEVLDLYFKYKILLFVRSLVREGRRGLGVGGWSFYILFGWYVGMRGFFLCFGVYRFFYIYIYKYRVSFRNCCVICRVERVLNL